MRGGSGGVMAAAASGVGAGVGTGGAGAVGVPRAEAFFIGVVERFGVTPPPTAVPRRADVSGPREELERLNSMMKAEEQKRREACADRKQETTHL
jgi:hypothetical protein